MRFARCWKRHAARAGFTLVELAVASLASAAVIGALLTMANTSSQAIGTMSGLGLVQFQLIRSMDALRQDASVTLTMPATCCSGVTADPTTWIFQVPSTAPATSANPGAAIASTYDYLVYTYTAGPGDQGQLTRKVYADVASSRNTVNDPTLADEIHIVARYLTGMTVTGIAKGITVTLNSAKTEGSVGTFIGTVTSDFLFRNAS